MKGSQRSALHFQYRLHGLWAFVLGLDARWRLGRQGQIELVEHQGLIGIGLGVAWQDQPTAVGGGQTDIQHLKRRQLFQQGPRSEAWSQGLQSLF